VLCISKQGRLQRRKGLVHWIVHFYRAKEGQTAHEFDGFRAKSFPLSMSRPAAAAQIHADEQTERLRADGISDIVALRSDTGEYAPLGNNPFDRN
jgi:hypothetical protein